MHNCIFCRRVELVLLHEGGNDPIGTAAWLSARPHLARHHHIRLSHPKVSMLHAAARTLPKSDHQWAFYGQLFEA